jgi:dihydrofolate reductase
MKTQYYTATSIDGYLANEDDSFEWLFQFKEIECIKGYPQFIKHVGAIAMGSTTYEWIIRHGNMLGGQRKWLFAVPTWVFSTRKLPIIEGADIRLVQGDVAPAHAEMVKAANGKNVWLAGGGDFAGQFHDHGLLDEIILNVAPVMLGSGIPLLPRQITTPPLKLVGVQRHNDTFVILNYEVQRSEER